MGRAARSEKWLLRHSVSQETLNEMNEIGYLMRYEKDGEMFYMPTKKSQEIW